MDPQEIIDLGRDAIRACLIVGGPILLASLVVGMLVGAIQAMTQVPDQSVSFVPKLICLVLALGVALPWLTDRMLDYSREILASPLSLRHYSQTKQIANLHPPATPNQRRLELSKPSERQAEKQTDKPEIQPSKPPFQLPNFRFSRVPEQDISG
jgi:flagellar biosynthetic protein FliQ